MAKKVPAGLQRGMDRLGIEVSPLVEPQAAPLSTPASAPQAAPPVQQSVELEAAVQEEPAQETAQSDGGLSLTFGNTPTVDPDTRRQLTIAEQAITLLQERNDAHERQIKELTAKLEAGPKTQQTADFNPDRVDTDELPGAAFDQFMAVLRPAITSYVDMRIEQTLAKVGADVENRIGVVTRKQATDSLNDRVQQRVQNELGVDFGRISESNEFKLFLREIVPGVGLETGAVLSRAWAQGDEDVMLAQIKRFVEKYRKGNAALAVTAPASAAPGPQFGRGGSAAPQRYSRRELHAQMDQARRRRDQSALGPLIAKLEAAERAGLLAD